MRTNLRKRLKQGELLLGTILSLNSPDIAEILSGIGFDWLFIDAGAAFTSTAKRLNSRPS